MSGIKILSQEDISKIAAGEVVERPASALKELIENSLDAGATSLKIDVEKAGKKLIRVADNGCGMSREDLALSLRRHSTSKISKFEDLEKLSTFGFRGEALYSIFAVSRIKIKTSDNPSDVSFSVEGEGGRIKSEEKGSPVSGTIVEVRDLFFNVPARLKFMKSDQSERAHILKCVEEAALANLDVSFTVRIDGVEIYNLRKSSGDFRKKLLERIKAVYGRRVAERMFYAEKEKGSILMKGFFSSAENLCSSSMNQNYFVNRRPVHSKTLRQALYKAYENLRGNRHPAVAAFIEADPSLFDINIHPQKKEVKFSDESSVFKLLREMLAEKLISEAEPVRAAPERNVYSVSSEGGASGSGEEKSIFGFPAAKGKEESEKNETSLFEEKRTDISSSAKTWYIPPVFYLGQIAESYLLFESGRGLLILDQHAAQERILYEKFISDYSRRKMTMQPFLAPIPVEMGKSQAENIMRWKDWLLSAGFEIENFGPGMLRVISVPSMFTFSDKGISEFITYLADILGDPEKSTQELKLKTIATLACKKAVKAGERMKEEEALHLIENLSRAEDSMHCPHGRPTLLFISKTDLSSRFRRSSPL